MLDKGTSEELLILQVSHECIHRLCGCVCVSYPLFHEHYIPSKEPYITRTYHFCIPDTPCLSCVYRRSPTPCLTSPQVPQKSPIFPQKSPRFPQKSSITAERVAFVSLVLQFSHLWSQTFTNSKTVLESLERAL